MRGALAAFVLALLPALAAAPAAATSLPSDIAGLQLWLDAGTGITADGSNLVSAWDDRAAFNRDATATGTERPLYVANVAFGRPAIHFDGSNDRFFLPAFSLEPSASATIFAVFANVGAASGTLIGKYNGGAFAGIDFHIGGGLLAGRIGNAAGSDYYKAESAASVQNAALHFASMLYTVGSGVDLRLDGVLSSDTTPTGTISSDQPGVPMTIGAVFNERYLLGDILELVVYDSALSAANRQAVEQYLAEKYSVPEPAGLALALSGAAALLRIRRTRLAR